ncbi:MAG: FAD-binding protein [Elusimicrobia bacterium]|nr:FAD-binding protein [Elusimicrobiota bacterium]
MAAPSPFSSLRSRLSPGALVTDQADLSSYSYDAALRGPAPAAVVLARRACDVLETVRFCSREGVPFTARGAGTNLAGGAVPSPGGILLSVARLDRILEIDTLRGYALVEPGVVNLDLQKRLEPLGFFYAPDPASHKVCTIGGNIAENAGGPRCLKYGVTTNHVLALEAVMPDGSLERFSLEDPGPEVVSLLAGSEGTLGVVTKAWLKILPAPEAAHTFLAGFDSLEAAMECVGTVIAAGVVPRSLESLDRATVESVEQYLRSGYPKTEAVLLIELDGTRGEVAFEAARVSEICLRSGAKETRCASEPAERERLWEGRRGAYPATARLAPNVLVEDGVVPRDRLAEAVRRIRAIAERRRVRTSLVFHAGDGNLHPNISYDERDQEEASRAREAGLEMLRACLELGGTISGEHGIGLEKREAMAWMFEPGALALFGRLKEAFDPRGVANPGKILPSPCPSRPANASPDGGRDARPPASTAPPAAAAFARPGPRPLGEAARHLVERVRQCAVEGRGMLVSGSGSRLPRAPSGKGERPPFGDGGSWPPEVPGREGLCPIVTAGMRTVLDLDRKNCTATVEAGISIQTLHLELGAQGRHLRLPKAGGTLGGLLASKAWVASRDDILGMRVALADGAVLDFGGKVVKNVAGYDVPRLLLGSWGALAVILDVTFKVYAASLKGLPVGPLPKPFGAGPWQRRVKAAFDPRNLLNPWLHPGAPA